MQNKKALTKFLRCVKWERPQESSLALQLLEKWTPIGVADALELLSPRFQNPTGIKYTVACLLVRLRKRSTKHALLKAKCLKPKDVNFVILTRKRVINFSTENIHLSVLGAYSLKSLERIRIEMLT